MKAVLLSLIMLSCFAFTQIKHLKGADILSRLQDEKSNEVSVILFTLADLAKSNPEAGKLANSYDEQLQNLL